MILRAFANSTRSAYAHTRVIEVLAGFDPAPPTLFTLPIFLHFHAVADTAERDPPQNHQFQAELVRLCKAWGVDSFEGKYELK